MAVELIVRKWGNSFGVVIPKEVAEREKLKENGKIVVEIVKKADLSSIFGTLKRKISGQKFKDAVRKGWS